MNASKALKILFVGTIGFAFVAGVAAQDDTPGNPPREEMQRPPGPPPQDDRGNALRELGLSAEQIRQIRQLNVERGPLMQEAQRRLREANRALDEAIYADEVKESDVQERLKDVNAAHSEVARIRFMNELAVRKILTPEQLARFRELRARFEDARRNFENRRRDRPMQRPIDGRIPLNDAKPRRPKGQPDRPMIRPN